MRHHRGVAAESGHPTSSSRLRSVPHDRSWTASRSAHLIDFFVYVVVLNLTIEYLPSVLSESFTLSLLTAALLKVALEVVLLLKGMMLVRLRAATSPAGKVAASIMLWGVAVGSKFVVLTMIDIAFGGAVSLGGFVSVTLLIAALLASRAGVRRMLRPDAALERRDADLSG